MRTVARLFVQADLAENTVFSLPKDQSHYLTRVMRRVEGDGLTLFNGRDGEWRCEIAAVRGKTADIRVVEQTRQQNNGCDLWLLFAPLKMKARMSFTAEKATELGVARLLPVITARTQTGKLRTDKLQATVIQAAEQTERLDVPEVADAARLQALLDGWDSSRQLIYADECGDDETRPWGGMPGRGAPIIEAVKANGISKASVLIGPEGGFTPEERAQLRSLDFVMPVSLGPRILRAETAAVAALTIWQSVVGDWR